MKSKRFFITIIKKVKNILFRNKITPAEQRERIIKNVSRNGVKDCFTGDDRLSVGGKQRLIKEDINKEARSVIKEAIDKPEILLDFIESRGTMIIKSGYMDKILGFFGEKQGFITPKSGIRALLFILINNIFSSAKLEIGFKTPAMFALKDEPVNIYTFSHQFHMWLSYINNLPGFEEKNMRNFRNFWEDGSESRDISYLCVDEIISLKDIIAREVEALNFVTEIAREFVGQKSSIKKLREGKSISL